MLNDRDDENKYEGPEESEYHFSEDEINYEIEDEAAKPEVVVTPETKKSFMNRLSGSKRMLIILCVFLGLVFVAYKMVSPTSSIPATDIVAAPATLPAQKSMASQPAVNNNPTQQSQSNVAQPPAAPVANNNPSPQVSAATNGARDTTSLSPAMQMAKQLAQSQEAMQASTQANQPVGQINTSNLPQQNNATPPAAIAATPITAMSQNSTPTTMPTVIPVQSVATPSNQPLTTATNSLPSSAVNNSMDTNMALVAAQSDRLISQLQGQYTQQLNEFSNQNKMLQNQIQSLNSRVVTMEGQLNQLVQVLTRRNQNNATVNQQSSESMSQQPAMSNEKLAYSVQAIIPGRAWLKSDNGETLTVAEGDTVKGMGRVTKIDPYDGIVEINTGTKIISLSYGNGS